MKVAVIYDFGVNKGGGDFVMLNIIEALSCSGFDLSLVTSTPHGLYEASELFDKNPPNVNIRYVKVSCLLGHPYSIAFIARKVRNENYELFIMSDDGPKCLNDKKVMLYVHYPHAARFIHPEYMAEKYSKSIIWYVHKQMFKVFYPTGKVSDKWLFIANSLITQEHMLTTYRNLNTHRLLIVNPPVAAKRITEAYRRCNVGKDDIVVSIIGRYLSNKRVEDLLYAISMIRRRRVKAMKAIVIGFSYDDKYLRYLTNLIRRLGLENDVRLLVGVNRYVLLRWLFRAKAIVNTYPFEPFGIAVVEGMAAGCIPIVRMGFNGPWTEIIKEGAFGYGFKGTRDLALIIHEVMVNYDNLTNINSVIARSHEFDESVFKERIIKVLEG